MRRSHTAKGKSLKWPTLFSCLSSLAREKILYERNISNMVLNWLFSFKIRRKFVFVNKKRGSWKDSKIFNISFPLELVISRLQTHHITVGKRTTKSGRFEDTLSPSAYLYEKFLPIQYWGCLSILTLSILTFSRMTL